MRQSFLFIALLLSGSAGAQGVGINNPTPHASALLDLTSTGKGLLMPRMTTVQRDAIAAPAASLLIFNTTNARFEYFDGLAWAPFIGGGTLDQAYDFGGAGAGRTITADAGAVRINGNAGLLVTGATIGTGPAIEVLGQGIRMFFNPAKAAFRAGGVGSSQWNPVNVGDYSFGANLNSTASGTYSSAFGFNSTAAGEAAVAFGNGSTAQGNRSLAAGQDNTAISFGETALGIGATIYTPTPTGGTQFGAANSFDRLLVVGNAIDANGNGLVDATERSDAFVIMKNGQTGINTSTPFASLHVRFAPPSANINPTLRLEVAQAASATNITFQNSVNGNLLSLGMSGNGDFGLASAANFSNTVGDIIRIKPNGNVGIGTLNAQDRLHVVGSIRMVDGNQAAGRVLVSDANGTGSWAAPASLASGTLDQAYDFGGAGAGRTILADAGAVTIAGADGLVSTGTIGSGALAPAGAGTRMVWNPRKGAFRAGTANLTNWDDANMGQGSFAAGTSTRALGMHSTALGQLTNADGLSSFTAGQVNTAAGSFSVALNFLNTALGQASTAMGSANTSYSFGETVLGIGATTYAPSSATAFGAAQSSDRLLVVGNAIDANSNTLVDAGERSDALVILKNGNTGIGISAPTHRLHVAGRSLFHDGFSADNAALLYRSNTDYMFIGPQSGSSANGGAIALFGSTNASSGNANGMDVNVPNGRVRFNHTNAQFEFRSSSTSGYTAFLELNDVGLQIGHNSVGRSINFNNGGGERMRIDAAGRVGIGTSAPATTLHVNGGIAMTPVGSLVITGNAFLVNPGDRSYLRFNSTGTPGVRQVILGNGLAPGQVLYIECAATGGNGISFLDGANMAVGGGLSRSLDLDDTITFIWNGAKWLEVGFSTN